MKPTFLASPSAKVMLLTNGAFWVLFAVNFFVNSQSYRPHPPLFEEEAPLYVYYGRALPAEQYVTPLMRATRFLQWPSFFAARPYFWYFDRHGIDGDRLYGGVSVTGYYLLIVCVLSFLQWYLVGVILDFCRRLVQKNPKNAPPHAFNADAP